MREGWKRVRLNEFVWFQRGFDLPKSKFKGGDIPVYGSTSILGYHNEIKVKAPGIITGRSGTLGVMQYTKEDFWPHNTTLWVKDFKGNDEKFAYYLLQCLDFKLFNSGGAVPTLNRNVLNSFIIDLPPLKTQHKIASILSAYDDLIENNLKRIKLLEEQAQQTYEEWFVRFKFPGYENALFDEESGLPVGWEKVKLGDVLEISSSKRIFLSDYVSEGIPFYRGKEIILKSKNEALNDRLFISKKKFREIKAKYDVPKEGDILLTAVGTLGYPYLVTKSDGEFYFKDGNLIWLKGNEKISSSYLISSFKNEHFQTILNNIAIGSSQKALTIKSLKAIKHIVPILAIQEKYDEIAISIYNSIENLQNQNQHLKEARDILLPRLMSGMIDVEKLEVGGMKYEVNASLGRVAEGNEKYRNEKKETKTSKQFKEAVLLAMHVNRYSTPTFTLSTYRYTKFSYLYRRFYDNKIADYKRKAAGPYNEKYKYKGPLAIALKNKYIKQSTGKYKGFEIGEKINEALKYAPNYWDNEVFTLVDKFRYKKDKELETITTIDNAILNLREKGSLINLETIKEDISKDDDWKHKLEQDNFSDENIRIAKRELEELFSY